MGHRWNRSHHLTHHLLLRLLAVRSRAPGQQGAISAAAGIVAAMVLILSSAAVVSYTSGNLRGVFASSDTRQARGAAAEGADLMIDSWNQPQNRALLVSGANPTSWNSADENLRSPCINSDGSRPGGDGRPTAAAINLADGEWRDVVTGQVGVGERQFRLRTVQFTASDGRTNPDPRVLRRSFGPEGNVVAALPTGVPAWRNLVNLQDPDGAAGPLGPGRNSGFIVLEVEGRVRRGDQVLASSRLTQEFEVLPKCCGASLGSQGSGGVARTNQSLGSDSRNCGLQWGMITGLNGGWHWSYYANDRFTSRMANGDVVNLLTILGAVADNETLFERSNCRVRPCAGAANNTNVSGDNTVVDARVWNNNIRNATPSPNTPPCRQPDGSQAYYPGPRTDIDGRTASCIPITPVRLSTIPRVDANYAFTPTPGGGWTDILSRAATLTDKVQNANTFPRLATGNATTAINELRLRTNDASGAQRVEICMVDQIEPCADNTWLTVSGQDPRNPNYYGAGVSAPGSLAFTVPPNQNLDRNNTTNIFSGINLSQLQVPYLSFRLSKNNNRGASEALRLRISPDGGGTWIPLTSANITRGSIATSGTDFRVGLPFSGDNVQIEFAADNEWGSDGLFIRRPRRITINDLRIESGQANVVGTRGPARYPVFGGAWCEYSSNSPRTAAPGFHCLGPTFDQRSGGSIVVDTSRGPLSFYYTEPENVDRRSGVANPSNPENFIYISRAQPSGQPSAEFRHVRCNPPELDCADPVPDNLFSPVGEPTQLNFFGRDDGANGNEQNITILTRFPTPTNRTQIGGVWFYFPQGRIQLQVEEDNPGGVPPGFYTNNDLWTYSGRIWVKNFKPYGAFHLRIPPSTLADNSGLFGAVELPAGGFVTWQGEDWVARAVTNTRLW